MKKLFKLLSIAVLATFLFGCTFITDNDVTIYNNTGYSIEYLYVIPASEYVDSDYHFSYNSNSSTYYGHYDWCWWNYSTEYYDLYNGYSTTATVDTLETGYYVVGFDTYNRRIYSKYFYSDSSSVTLNSYDYEYTQYYY